MQYMCGLSELTDKPILDPSLFVTVRKQLERYLLPWHLRITVATDGDGIANDVLEVMTDVEN